MPIQLDDYIQRLPKTETHLHLEGALPWELLQTLDPVRYAQTPPWWEDDFRFDSFAHFEGDLLNAAFAWYTSPERYHEAAKLVFCRHQEQNVRYVETSFASGVIEFLGLDGPAIAEAIKSAAPEGLTVRVFMGIHRNGYTDSSRAALDSCHQWKHLDGIDLHGTETLPLEAWASPLWQRLRDAGKAVKAHTGEFCGPGQVREIVEALGVKRIEHGVRAIEDPAVVDFLREQGVALDVCPISNVKLRVSPDYASHPLPRLMQAGLVCTLSTDDPLMFGNRINDEYRVAAEEMGLDRTALALLARNGFSVALIDAAEKARHLADLESIIYGR